MLSLKSGKRYYPMTGLEMWKNEKNKFLVFELHYSADPRKRDPKYIENIRAKMPVAQFNQEYEKNWESFYGLPVFADWTESFHGTVEDIKPVPGLPLLRGWDFGLTPACVIGQYVEGQLRILREYTEMNMGVDRFSDKVIEACQLEYPYWLDPKKHWMDFIDPSGEFRKDTDEGTCARILDSKGLMCIPGAISWEDRRTAVESFLLGIKKGRPNFLLSIPNCPVLYKGFQGGYRYNEKVVDKEPSKLRPLKDEHSHAQDALQYMGTRIVMMNNARQRRAHVPRMSYSFIEEQKDYGPIERG